MANPRGIIAVDKMGTKVLFLNAATYETEVVLDGFEKTVHELRQEQLPASKIAKAFTHVQAPRLFAIELMYSDHEGGQRAIGRFSMAPLKDSVWLCSVVRHWNLDRPDPR